VEDKPEFLLVYGTLLRSLQHPYSHLLSTHGQCLGTASFRGRLFDLGHYPGATFDPDLQGQVKGELHLLKTPQKVIPILDKYEGIGSRFGKPHEFIRIKIPVLLSGRRYESWIYFYNLNTAGKKIIESGDYLKFMSQNTKAAYSSALK